MPTVKDKITGDVVSKQPYNEEGIQKASNIAESNPNWEITNAPDSRESYHIGGKIPGDAGFGERPINPGMDDNVSTGIIPNDRLNPFDSTTKFAKGGKVKGERKAGEETIIRERFESEKARLKRIKQKKMFGRKMMAKAAQQKPKKEKKGITGPYSEKLGPEGYGGEVRKQKVRKAIKKVAMSQRRRNK